MFIYLQLLVHHQPVNLVYLCPASEEEIKQTSYTYLHFKLDRSKLAIPVQNMK